MWTPSQRTRTAPEAAGASWTNTNTLPPMSSATLCTEACHGGHALHSLVPLVYGPKWWDKCAHVASRVKRSCASNRIRVSLHCCPQTSCVGWEYLLYSIGLYRCARVCVKKRLAFWWPMVAKCCKQYPGQQATIVALAGWTDLPIGDWYWYRLCAFAGEDLSTLRSFGSTRMGQCMRLVHETEHWKLWIGFAFAVDAVDSLNWFCGIQSDLFDQKLHREAFALCDDCNASFAWIEKDASASSNQLPLHIDDIRMYLI